MKTLEQLFTLIRDDRDYQNVKDALPDLKDMDEAALMVGFHALRVNLNDQFFISPLVSSCALRQLIESPGNAHSIIAGLRQIWPTNNYHPEKWSYAASGM